MTVTGITPFDKRRSKVTLDEDFTLVLYKGEIKRFGIEDGGELTEETYGRILDEVLLKRAVERSCFLLKSSDKTETEIRRKLKEGYYPAEAVEHAIDFLKRYHYIDDDNYARRYVESYSTKKSRRQILYDLQQKGIEREVAEELLEDQPVDEDGQIRTYMRKKRFDPGTCRPEEQRKVMAALGRKGFSYEAISRVMGERSEEL